MPGLCRLGDYNEVGGQLMNGATTVFCNGLPVAMHPSDITPHKPWKPTSKHIPHNACSTTMGFSLSVSCEGFPVVLVGTGNSCKMHSIISGSMDVDVGL